jgi:hypothetical protein
MSRPKLETRRADRGAVAEAAARRFRALVLTVPVGAVMPSLAQREAAPVKRLSKISPEEKW